MGRSKPPSDWNEELRAQLAEVEARLLSKIVAERNTRERDGAELDETLQEMDDRLDKVADEQARWIRRLRWLEQRIARVLRRKKT